MAMSRGVVTTRAGTPWRFSAASNRSTCCRERNAATP